MSSVQKQIWRKALLTANATIRDAISNLEKTALQIVLVVSEDNRLLGTITDGDIRRSLLRGLDINSSIEQIMHRDAFVVPPSVSLDTALNLMQTNKIHQLPAVDDERHVVGLYLWDKMDTPNARPNLMVIMAGGFGTRLYPYTEHCPKPLLAVAGKPMLEHIISRAKMEGFERFIFAIHYLGHMIEDYFGNGERWDVNIDYIREKIPMGTAGALSLLDPLPEKPIIVTNGDVLADIHYKDLLDFHVHNHASATMAIRLHEWQHPFGIVHTEGMNITGFKEKPISRSHINAGIYAIDPSVIQVIGRTKYCDMPSLFERLHKSGKKTLAYPMHEPWTDIGRLEDLKKAQRDKSNAKA